MKSTTRNMLCAITVAPVVALFAGVPAQAAEEGPQAKPLELEGKKNPVANLAHPVLGPLSYLGDDTVRSIGTSRIEKRRDGAHEASALLGPTSSEKHGLQAKGIGSKCVTSADGRTTGATVIEDGTVQGAKLPEFPQVGQKVPLKGDAYAILNEHVRTLKGYTVIGARVVDEDGRTTDLAKSECVTPKKMMSAQRRVPNGTAEQEAAPARPGPGGNAGDLLGNLLTGLLGMESKLDEYMRKEGGVLKPADELGEKVGLAAVPGSPQVVKPESAKAAPQAGAPQAAAPQAAPGSAPQAEQTAPRAAAASQSGPEGRPRAAVVEPEPRLLGSRLPDSGGDTFDALKGSGSNNSLKTAIINEKDKQQKRLQPTESGLLGGLPGLSQLPPLGKLL